MDIYKPRISEQLSNKANTAQQWVLTKKVEGKDSYGFDPTKFFQIIRDFSNALGRIAALEKANDLEWTISLCALVETAQMVTTVLSELTEERFITCLILLRPAQELAQTIRYALKEGALVEWYEYSIEEDIRDLQEQISMIEDGLNGNWPLGFSPETAKEQIAHGKTKSQELKDLKMELGDRRSDKDWKSLVKRWRPTSKDLAKRLKGLHPEIPLHDLHTSSWAILNSYIHARSREFSPPPNLDTVMLQLQGTMFHLDLAGKELAEKFNL